MKRRIRSVECKCRSGNFCSIHGRYGLRDQDRPRQHDRDDEDFVVIQTQTCGGGRRILRKRLGD